MWLVRRINAADFDKLKADLVGQPAMQKEFVRQQQLEFRQGYDDVKKLIDHSFLSLRNAKRAIDENPEKVLGAGGTIALGHRGQGSP
jgi:hypothetical protein